MNGTRHILGISAFFHDSSATLLVDGKIIAAAQEERFSRIKHDSAFPENAIKFCLEYANIDLYEIDDIIFFEKPFLKFSRIINNYVNYAPRGLKQFFRVIPTWINSKLDIRNDILSRLKVLTTNRFDELPAIKFSTHHRSHAASAFFPSPYENAAILCLDGVGELESTSGWLGKGNRLKKLWSIEFPHSIGLLYAAFTYYTGFKVNSGEYKLMGLAPYGVPRFVDLIKKYLVILHDDGSFRLNMKFFDFAIGDRMINSKFEKLFGAPARQPESGFSQHYFDVAASIQLVTEEMILGLVNMLHQQTSQTNLCLSGGVALNCVANGRILREGPFKNLWIQPASGDAGGSLGAALTLWNEAYLGKREINKNDQMQGSLLGPEYSNQYIERVLNYHNANYAFLRDDELIAVIARKISQGNIVAWFQGRMEFGPRALGNRSFLGDPRNPEMQRKMNLKIKFRESFRPFAPAVLAESANEYFNLNASSPYMLLVSTISDNIKYDIDKNVQGFNKLDLIRSEVPAVTHVDYSARIQTVDKDLNPKFYNLINQFYCLTSVPMLINTSFNIRGEPIVCSPYDALRCFMKTDTDYLVLGNHLLEKTKQLDIKNIKLNYPMEVD